MATQGFTRALCRTLASLRLTTTTANVGTFSPRFSLFHRLRPLTVAANLGKVYSPTTVRGLATRATSSSLNDPNPNWSNRPPKETILLDGCDFEHWLVVMEKPEGDPTRDEIIDSYIKTLAMIVGSEEEARMKIYSVSTRCYFAFGCLVSEELSYKLKELPKVRWVLPDSYLDVKNKDYGGEPFINGQAVPYDPKYHEEWIRNNARANERNRRNDRPRNFDRSRNFERRRENMQNREFQNPSIPNQAVQNAGPNMGGPPPNMSGAPPNMGGAPPNMGGAPPNMGGAPPNNFSRGPPNPNMGGPPTNPSGMPPQNFGGMPPNNRVGAPPNNYGGVPPPPNYGGVPPPPNNSWGGPPPPNNYGGGPPPPNNYGGMPPPHNNYGGMPPPQNSYGGMPPPNSMGGMPPPNNMGGMQSNTGWAGNMPDRDRQNNN